MRLCVSVVISRYGLAVVVGERVIEASLVKDRRPTVSRSVNRAFNSFFGQNGDHGYQLVSTQHLYLF